MMVVCPQRSHFAAWRMKRGKLEAEGERRQQKGGGMVGGWLG